MVEIPERYRMFRPAWRAFFIHIFAALVFSTGPLINPQAPISPAISGLIATAFVALMVLHRFSTLYGLTHSELAVLSCLPTSSPGSVRIEEIKRIDLRWGATQRLLNVAHVWIYTDPDAPARLKLFGVPRPREFKALLMELGASDKRVYGAFRS